MISYATLLVGGVKDEPAGPARSLTARRGGVPVEDLLIFLVGNLLVVNTVVLVTVHMALSRLRTCTGVPQWRPRAVPARGGQAR